MRSSYVAATPSTFELHARPMLRNSPGLYNVAQARRFRSLFGVAPAVCAATWNRLELKLPENAKPYHLLWAVLFLKAYASEAVHCAVTQIDEKTFREWVWIFVTFISELQVVRKGILMLFCYNVIQRKLSLISFCYFLSRLCGTIVC